ncbi:hypothetical protein C0991_009611 [Blastosporella zonata]|nr:hypothetical protein C0991_009611 [Blastosporella zonata]
MFKLLVALSLSLCALANTEVINFHISELYNDEISFASTWPMLNHTHNEHEWTMIPSPFGTPMSDVCSSQNSAKLKMAKHPCPYELWLVLDLTHDWATYSSFTLRLSWPAHYPTDFSLHIFDPESLSIYFGLPAPQNSHVRPPSQTRRRYARIRLVDTGILTPSTPSTKPDSPAPVPFILVLEPLYFGVLPPSVVPVLGYIAIVSLFAWMSVPRIIKYLEMIAVEARKELNENVKSE